MIHGITSKEWTGNLDNKSWTIMLASKDRFQRKLEKPTGKTPSEIGSYKQIYI